MNRMNALRLLAWIALFAAGTASAQVYKCVDASGKTVYLQSPCPPGQSSKVIRATPPANPPAAPAAKAGDKAPLTPEQAFQKRQKDRQEAEKKAGDEQAEARRKQEACQQAREQLSRFDSGMRIAGVNPQGERYYLDDAQVAQEKARAQAAANQWCN
jgi:hypothetical protein